MPALLPLELPPRATAGGTALGTALGASEAADEDLADEDLADEDITDEDRRTASVQKLCDASAADISTLYTVQDLLGEGRFSKVYSVVEEATGQVLALKELDKGAIVEDEEGLEMLEAEVLALKRAGNAPHVVRLQKVIAAPDAIYLAMDRVPGRALVDVIDERGALECSYVRHLMLQLLTALAALAEVGVVHRDVKPENIMVSEDETERPHLTLIDFGYAALLGGGDAPTELTGVAGSPEYAAPEVLSWIAAEADETGEVVGEPYDAGCDVWSVGVTAHVLLCAELPFDLPKEATEEALVAAARHVDLSFRRLKGEARVRRGKMMATLEGEAAMAPARAFVRACMAVARPARPSAQQLLDHPWLGGKAVAQVASVEVVYVFTAEGASDVREQLGVTLSAGDPLTDPLLAAVREGLQVPASMTNDQLKAALVAQGFLECKTDESGLSHGLRATPSAHGLRATPPAPTLAPKPLTALATTALATPASGPGQSATHAGPARSIQRTYGAPHYCSPRQAP
jgi:serine/threonine protein kinase